MKPSPCLNPVRVFNKTLRQWQYVPCGHCDACLCSKGFNLSNRLGNAVALYTHKYFVTLTFSDDYLPVAKYDELTDTFIHPFDYDYDGVLYSVPLLTVEQSLSNSDFKKSFEKYNGVPVLSRRLLINFKKRLRKQFAKYYGKEYLFIYGVGEYGPTTLRPHYHLILCTNASINASVLESCVHKAWSDFDKNSKKYISEYGRIDLQRIISKGVRNYVAQYLNSFTALPPVYAAGLFRTFYQSSPLIDSDSIRFGNPTLEKLFDCCSPETVSVSLQDNANFDDVLPIGIINRYFPKCPQFSALSHFDRVQLYSVFEKQPFSCASEFANNIISSFSTCDDALYLAKSICVSDDYHQSYNSLVKLYYISRRVCVNAKRLCVSLEVYVDRICLFWSRYELLKLRRFYELQESLLNDKFNPVELPMLLTLYYDTDDKLRNLSFYLNQFGYLAGFNIEQFPLQRSYSQLMRKIILDTSKTKKRNDYFEKNHFKRPNYLLSHSKNLNLCRKFFQI